MHCGRTLACLPQTYKIESKHPQPSPGGAFSSPFFESQTTVLSLLPLWRQNTPGSSNTRRTETAFVAGDGAVFASNAPSPRMVDLYFHPFAAFQTTCSSGTMGNNVNPHATCEERQRRFLPQNSRSPDLFTTRCWLEVCFTMLFLSWVTSLPPLPCWEKESVFESCGGVQ